MIKLHKFVDSFVWQFICPTILWTSSPSRINCFLFSLISHRQINCIRSAFVHLAPSENPWNSAKSLLFQQKNVPWKCGSPEVRQSATLRSKNKQHKRTRRPYNWLYEHLGYVSRINSVSLPFRIRYERWNKVNLRN